MNGEQKRKLEMLKSAARAGAAAERERIIRVIVHQYSVVMATIMHDKYGFDGKKLLVMLDYVNDLWDSIIRDYVTVGDLEECLKEETGLEVIVATR